VQELPLALIRLGFLALLWIFVLSAVRVIRTDLFGTPPRTRPQPRGYREPPPRQRRSQARRVVVTSGPLAGTIVDLTGAPVTIGRAGTCTLSVGDDYVSNEHARLVLAGDRWLVEDLGSTNGTFLGQQRVESATPVPLGAPIRVGKTTLELRR
jgi:pSer/pThr/pTyr-binding forkhead associated (FHA) protein